MLGRNSLAGLVLLALSTVDRAGDEAPDPAGKPTYKVGSGVYAVWHDEGGWHFRATAETEGQQFTGKIVAVGGEFTAMKPYATTAGGKRSADPAPKMEKVGTKEFTVSYTLKKGSESGFDLKLDKRATGIKFVELKIDAKEDPAAILIGAKGAHPAETTFDLPVRPGKK